MRVENFLLRLFNLNRERAFIALFLCLGSGCTFRYSVCELYVPKEKTPTEKLDKCLIIRWALTDSNRRPSACKADALNQLS